MFKLETVNKVMAMLSDTIRDCSAMQYSELRLHISKGNRKIGKTHNFSMAPGHTCSNCGHYLPYCYDVKACLQYPNTVIKARAENTAMMKMNREATFAAIDKYISTYLTD